MEHVSFKQRCYKLVQQIPSGKISTYKAIAIATGSPMSARAVGLVMSKNTRIPEIPCHRVVASNGRLCGYAQGLDRKIERLQKEGINIKNGKVIHFDNFFFDSFLYPFDSL